MKIYFKEFNINNTDFNNLHKSASNDLEELNIRPFMQLYEFLLLKYKDGFEENTKVFVNQKEIKVEDFDIELKDSDIVVVSRLPGFLQFIIMLIVYIVISVVLAKYFTPKVPDSSTARSVYSSNVDQISAALNEAVPIQYGRLRQYPKMITSDYKFYKDNNEFHVITTTLGPGDFEFHNIFLNETRIVDLLEGQIEAIYLKSGVKDIKNSIAERVGSSYAGYVIQNPTELANVELAYPESNITYVNVPYFFNPERYKKKILSQTSPTIKYTAWGSVNAPGTEVDRILVNLLFQNGIWSTDSEGNEQSATAEIYIQVAEIDFYGNETGYTFTHKKTYSILDKTPQRYTEVINVVPGRYKIRVYRTDSKGSRDYKDCKIESILGFDTNNNYDSLTDLSVLIFIARVSDGINATSAINLNCDCTRLPDSVRSYNTLFDFVKDIWTNPVYGMNESLEFLDIRDEMNIPISLILDKSEQAFDHLHSVLKSFGYVIFPYLNKFVIKKEAAQVYRKMLFSSKNTSSINYTYNLPDDNEVFKGVKVRYIPKTLINFESEYFPEDLEEYEESILPGVYDPIQAKRMAQFIYDKKQRILKTCTIKTDLRGYIPELFSKIGVSTEYLDDNIAALGLIIDYNNQTIKIDRKIEITDTNKYIIIEDQDNNSFGPFALNNENGYTNVLSFNFGNLYIEQGKAFQVVIGNKIEVIEDYLLIDISQSEIILSNENNTELTLKLQQYEDSIYQELEV